MTPQSRKILSALSREWRTIAEVRDQIDPGAALTAYNGRMGSLVKEGVVERRRQAGVPEFRLSEAAQSQLHGLLNGDPFVADVTLGEVTLEKVTIFFEGQRPRYDTRSVMDAIGLSRATMVATFLGDLEESSRGSYTKHTLGGPQQASYITLAGVFFCCAKARGNAIARAVDEYCRKLAENATYQQAAPEGPPLTAMQVLGQMFAALGETDAKATLGVSLGGEAKAIATGTQSELHEERLRREEDAARYAMDKEAADEKIRVLERQAADAKVRIEDAENLATAISGTIGDGRRPIKGSRKDLLWDACAALARSLQLSGLLRAGEEARAFPEAKSRSLLIAQTKWPRAIPWNGERTWLKVWGRIQPDWQIDVLGLFDRLKRDTECEWYTMGPVEWLARYATSDEQQQHLDLAEE